MSANFNRGNPGSGAVPPLQPRHLLGFAILFLALVGTGSIFYQVDQDEAGVVQRFGKYVRTTTPGLHTKIPFGVETVRRIKTLHVYKEEFGFQTAYSGTRTVYANRQDIDVSLMLTGDLNVAVVEWIVQYKIKDPVQFAFRIRDPIATLRNMSEAVMRLVIGDHTISEVLTSGRENIQHEAEKKLQEILDSYESGIDIQNVILQEVVPPNQVKPSFNEVNQARQEKEKLVNQAWAEYNKIIPKAKGEAEQRIRNAEGYAVERTNQAKGDAERFMLTWEAYKNFPDVTRRRLYLEMVSKVYPLLQDKLVIDQNQKGLLPLLNLNPKKGEEAAS